MQQTDSSAVFVDAAVRQLNARTFFVEAGMQQSDASGFFVDARVQKLVTAFDLLVTLSLNKTKASSVFVTGNFLQTKGANLQTKGL